MTDTGADSVQDSGAVQDPYRVLYVMPTAPQELIVELYWHLVRKANSGQTGGRPLLQLNEAYGSILQAQRPMRDPPGRTPSQDDANAAGQSPWAILHVRREAPPDVIEAAYRFWRLRARGEAPEQLAKLDAAYRHLSSPDAPDAEPDPAPGDATAEPRRSAASAAGALLVVLLRWLSAASVRGLRALASGVLRAVRWLAPRLGAAGYRGLVLLVLAVRWCWAATARGMRWAAPVVAETVRRTINLIRSAPSDQAKARPARPPRPAAVVTRRSAAAPATPTATTPEPAGDPSVEQRFAALAARK
jgi:hypothetical protein